MIRRVLLAVAVLVTLVATPAHADEDETRSHRFISRDVCVERGPSLRGWHLGEAAAAWTRTGLVNVTLQASCDEAASKVIVRERWVLPLGRSGQTSWPAKSYMYGGHVSATVPGQWTYPEALTQLNADHLRWVDPEDRRCFGLSRATHELGHALGLWHATGSVRVMSGDHDYRAHCGTIAPEDIAALAALGYPAGS